MSKYGIQNKGTGRAVIKKPVRKASLKISGTQPWRPKPGSPYPHSPRPKLKKGGKIKK